MLRAGEGDALMKGSLHTDELMAEVLRKDIGIRTARRVSHVFILDVLTYAKPLFITDAAANISPTMEDKVDIVQNAIALAQALWIGLPKVAILSALETISSKIPSTIDAATLCKMAERGRITGVCSTGHSHSIMQSTKRWRHQSTSTHPSPVMPTFCWCPTSKPAIWSPRS